MQFHITFYLIVIFIFHFVKVHHVSSEKRTGSICVENTRRPSQLLTPPLQVISTSRREITQRFCTHPSSDNCRYLHSSPWLTYFAGVVCRPDGQIGHRAVCKTCLNTHICIGISIHPQRNLKTDSRTICRHSLLTNNFLYLTMSGKGW